MSPVDGAGIVNPNLPVDRAVTEGRVPDRSPGADPRAARGRLPGRAARADRGADGALPGPQIGLDPGALGGAAALRLVHAGGDPPGRRGDAGDARLPGVGGELLRPAAHRAGRHPQGRGLHQHQLLDARRRRAARRLPRGRRGTTRSFFVTGFECLGACDIAPMASIDERYFGPLEAAEAKTAIEQLRAGAEVLPEKALEKRAAAGRRPMPETRMLLEERRRPGAAHDRRLQGLRRLRHAGEGLPRDGGRRGAQGARRLGPARARRRRLLDGQKGLLPAPRRDGASTSAATPTSPSRAPSRTAS